MDSRTSGLTLSENPERALSDVELETRIAKAQAWIEKIDIDAQQPAIDPDLKAVTPHLRRYFEGHISIAESELARRLKRKQQEELKAQRETVQEKISYLKDNAHEGPLDHIRELEALLARIPDTVEFLELELFKINVAVRNSWNWILENRDFTNSALNRVGMKRRDDLRPPSGPLGFGGCVWGYSPGTKQDIEQTIAETAAMITSSGRINENTDIRNLFSEHKECHTAGQHPDSKRPATVGDNGGHLPDPPSGNTDKREGHSGRWPMPDNKQEVEAPPISKAPAPITPVSKCGPVYFPPKPINVPRYFPPSFPSTLRVDATVVIVEAIKEYPRQSEMLLLCKAVISRLASALCGEVAQDLLRSDLALNAMADLVWYLLAHNSRSETQARELDQQVKLSDEWLQFAKAIQETIARNDNKSPGDVDRPESVTPTSGVPAQNSCKDTDRSERENKHSGASAAFPALASGNESTPRESRQEDASTKFDRVIGGYWNSVSQSRKRVPDDALRSVILLLEGAGFSDLYEILEPSGREVLASHNQKNNRDPVKTLGDLSRKILGKKSASAREIRRAFVKRLSRAAAKG